MKKLKCVFIDMVEDREKRIEGEEDLALYSTFQEYPFNQIIESRVTETFGWSTDLLKSSENGIFNVSIHIITSRYLKLHGVTQHFYSPHGPKYDDKYSYLHGMNLLAFEGYSRSHLIFTIKRINHIIQEKLITGRSKKRPFRSVKENELNSYTVPVDRPRIGILTPTLNLKTTWVQDLSNISEYIIIANDLRDLVPDIPPDNFVDYSLSRSYKFILDDYIQVFEQILEIV